jgi:hypothetical protein
MTTTSALAKETFAPDFADAKKSDDDYYVYVIGERQRQFGNEIAKAVIAATFQRVNDIFDEITTDPVSPRDDGIRIVSTQTGVKVLAIQGENGEEFLYAWAEVEKRTLIRLFKAKAPLPAALRDEIDALINGQDFDLVSLQKAKDMAEPFSIQSRGQYVYPNDVDGIIESIDRKGIEKARGDTLIYGSSFPTKYVPLIRGTMAENSSMKAIEQITKIIGLEHAERDWLGDHEYLDFLIAGTSEEQEDSLVALHLETLLDRKMDMIKEIVSASEYLELDHKTYVCYGDSDRNVFVERAANKDIYVHNNIDRFENVYLIALNGDGNDYDSVDIHISKPWYSTLYSSEIYDDEPMTWETLGDFIKYQDENGGTLREDQVVKALLAGEKPGLVGSYDLKTGEFTRGPFFENTTVLGYLSDMIDIDHEALTSVVTGEFDGGDSIVIKTRDEKATELGDEDGVKIGAWLEKVGKTNAPSP